MNERRGSRARPEPLDCVAISLAVVAATLLAGNVIFAIANADATNAGTSDRFRLLGQAANPFIAFLALCAAALVVLQRRDGGVPRQVASAAALGISTAISIAVCLLALNGVVTDLLGGAGALFRLSAVVSRMAAVAVSGLGLWLSVTAQAAEGVGGPSADGLDEEP